MKPGVARAASTRTLAAFVHNLSYSDLPTSVVQGVEELFIHYSSVAGYETGIRVGEALGCSHYNVFPYYGDRWNSSEC